MTEPMEAPSNGSLERSHGADVEGGGEMVESDCADASNTTEALDESERGPDQRVPREPTEEKLGEKVEKKIAIEKPEHKNDTESGPGNLSLTSDPNKPDNPIHPNHPA